MASPQLENGYTKIANELMDALARACPGFSNGQVLMAVIRKTYGWKKKDDFISISQIMEITSLSRRTVIYAIQNLEAMSMIIVNRDGAGRSRVNCIGVQKDYTLWKPEERGESYKKTLAKMRGNYQKKGAKKVQFLAPINNDKGCKELTINDESLHHSLPIFAPIPEKVSLDNDESLHPQKKETIKETITKEKEIFLLPEWLDKKTWDAFLEMRKKQKAPPTVHAMELLVKVLTDFKDKGQDPNALLEQSIINGWKSVYPIKSNGGNGNGHEQSGQATGYRGNPSQKPAGAFQGLE